MEKMRGTHFLSGALILTFFLTCEIASVYAAKVEMVEDLYGLDEPGASPLGNAVLAVGEQKADKILETSVISSAPAQEMSQASASVVPAAEVSVAAVESDTVPAESESEALAISDFTPEAVAEWKNPLEILLALPAEQWDLKDPSLTLEVSIALMGEGVVEKIRQLRRQTRELWMAWKKADAKSAPFASLIKQVQKLADKPGMFPGANDRIAEWIVLADIAADREKYQAEAFKITRHVSYNYLLMSVLGAPFFDAKEARIINGVPLSDLHCRNRFFSILVSFYRREYDGRYQAARDYQALGYGKRFSISPADLLLLEEADYLGFDTPDAVKLNAGFDSAQWQEVAAASRIRAHEETCTFVQKKLDAIGNTLFLFQARLEAVCISDSFFQYPDAHQASSAGLRDPHTLSILVGILYRLGERMCRGLKVAAMDRSDMQTVMSQEYKGQRALRHIPLEVPFGEKDARGVVGHRRSFEARLGLLLGDIDFFEPRLLPPAIKETIGSLINGQGAAKLYKTIMFHNAYLNGIAWGIIPLHRKQKVLEKFQEGIAVVRGNIEKFGLLVGSQEEISRSYRQLIDAIYSWGPHAAFTYKSPFGLSGRTGAGQVKCSMMVYQALYKLLWFYIWSRLQVVASLHVQARTIKKMGAEVNLRESDVVFDGKGMLRTDIGSAQEKQTETTDALQRARDFITDTSSTITYRVQQGMNQLAKKGDVDGTVDETLNALKDMALFVNNMKGVSADLFQQSVATCRRGEELMIALQDYTQHLSDFVIKKIGKVQKGVRDFADFWLVKATVFMTKIPGVKGAFRNAMSRFLSTVKEGDDAQEERRMKESLMNVQRALQRGPLSLTDQPRPLMLTDQPRSKVLDDITKRASMTLEGRNQAVSDEYGLDEGAQKSPALAAVK